jgi:hypothetical protein
VGKSASDSDFEYIYDLMLEHATDIDHTNLEDGKTPESQGTLALDDWDAPSVDEENALSADEKGVIPTVDSLNALNLNEPETLVHAKMTQPLPSVTSEKGHMLYSLASKASVQQYVPSAHTLSDTVSLNGVVYCCQVNCASVHCLSSFPDSSPVPNSLMDGGANGGLSCSDVRVISESVLSANVSGIGNTNLTNLPLCTVAGLIQTTAGPIVGIFNQYAHLGTGHTIHSCNQMRSYGAIADDVPCALGGDQHIISPNGCYVLPLSVAGGLTYLKMQPPSDHDLETFEWVPFTSCAAWDPSYLSDSASTLLAKSIDLAEKDLGHVPMIDSSLLKLTACSFKKYFGISEHEAWGDVDWMHPIYTCCPAVPLLVAADAVMRQITKFSSVWICIALTMLNFCWLNDLANVADILKCCLAIFSLMIILFREPHSGECQLESWF